MCSRLVVEVDEDGTVRIEASGDLALLLAQLEKTLAAMPVATGEVA